MTFVGHILTGSALGALLLPARLSRLGLAAGIGLLAFLACIPDLPLPGWGHDRYMVSHSIFINSGAVLAGWVGLCASGAMHKLPGTWLTALAGAGAWMSHLLLDSFYNHAGGIRILWPLSQWRLKLPIPWFHTFYPGSRLSPQNLQVMAIEAGFYGSLLALCLVARRFLRRGRNVLPKL